MGASMLTRWSRAVAVSDVLSLAINKISYSPILISYPLDGVEHVDTLGVRLRGVAAGGDGGSELRRGACHARCAPPTAMSQVSSTGTAPSDGSDTSSRVQSAAGAPACQGSQAVLKGVGSGSDCRQCAKGALLGAGLAAYSAFLVLGPTRPSTCGADRDGVSPPPAHFLHCHRNVWPAALGVAGMCCLVCSLMHKSNEGNLLLPRQ